MPSGSSTHVACQHAWTGCWTQQCNQRPNGLRLVNIVDIKGAAHLIDRAGVFSAFRGNLTIRIVNTAWGQALLPVVSWDKTARLRNQSAGRRRCVSNSQPSWSFMKVRSTSFEAMLPSGSSMQSTGHSSHVTGQSTLPTIVPSRVYLNQYYACACRPSSLRSSLAMMSGSAPLYHSIPCAPGPAPRAELANHRFYNTREHGTRRKWTPRAAN